MLRKIRVVLAAIFFTCITLLFLDFTGTLHAWFGWMAKIQFFPAILALNAGVVIILMILTLVFGRVYCSVICPLGVFQDIVSWINGKRGKKTQDEIPLFAREIMAEVRSAGPVHCRTRGRHRLFCCPS